MYYSIKKDGFEYCLEPLIYGDFIFAKYDEKHELVGKKKTVLKAEATEFFHKKEIELGAKFEKVLVEKKGLDQKEEPKPSHISGLAGLGSLGKVSTNDDGSVNVEFSSKDLQSGIETLKKIFEGSGDIKEKLESAFGKDSGDVFNEKTTPTGGVSGFTTSGEDFDPSWTPEQARKLWLDESIKNLQASGFTEERIAQGKIAKVEGYLDFEKGTGVWVFFDASHGVKNEADASNKNRLLSRFLTEGYTSGLSTFFGYAMAHMASVFAYKEEGKKVDFDTIMESSAFKRALRAFKDLAKKIMPLALD